MATPLLPKIPGGMGILWPNWVTKVVEELRSHGQGVTKRAYGLRVTSRGSVGSNEVTRSLGHMEVMRPWWSCCHLHSCSGKSGGTPGSRVPQRPTRSRGTLMEETKCKAQPHDPHSLPPRRRFPPPPYSRTYWRSRIPFLPRTPWALASNDLSGLSLQDRE